MKPNILLIHWHDLGQHLGCYGHPVTSPHVDNLARESVLFREAFCTTPLCSPSRATLFTGRYSHCHGVMGLAHDKFPWHYNAGERTLIDHLNDAGYYTALFGMQHEAKHAHQLTYAEFTQVPSNQPAGPVSSAAVDFLRGRAGAKAPFFASVGFFEVHRWGVRGYPAEKYEPTDSASVEVPHNLPDTTEIRAELAGFYGAIKYADACTGRVLEALEQAGLSDNTWVIFTTDHGFAFPRAKSTLYDPGLQVALMMRWPQGFKGQRESRTLVSHIDLVPTILTALHLDVPPNVQGQSYWNFLTQSDYVPRTEVFAEKNYHGDYDPMRTVRTSRWKFIRNYEPYGGHLALSDINSSAAFAEFSKLPSGKRQKEELYDLLNDPHETKNLAQNPAYFEIGQGLSRKLDLWQKNTKDPILDGPIFEPVTHC